MLAELEETLVALCANRELRERFARDPALAEVRPDLVARLPPLPAIERYARSLLRKRWSEVVRVTRLTHRICPRLEARYLELAADRPARATASILSPGAAEALRLLPELCAAMDDGDAAHAADLLAYEVLSACTHEDGEPRRFVAQFDVHAIATELRAGILSIDPDPQPTLYTFTHGRITAAPFDPERTPWP